MIGQRLSAEVVAASGPEVGSRRRESVVRAGARRTVNSYTISGFGY